jgi:hypothetical protein
MEIEVSDDTGTPLTARVPKASGRSLESVLAIAGIVASKEAYPISVNGKDVASRLFFYERDIANMLQYGASAPTSAELIYIDPNAVTKIISHTKSPRINTGLVRDGDWDLDASDIASVKKINGVRQRIVGKLDWENTDCWSENLKYLEPGARGDGIRSMRDIAVRYRKLEKFIRQVEKEREAAFRPRSAMRSGNFREAGGVIVNIGRNGELIFGMRGCHRLGIARAFNLAYIPVQLGMVHKDAVTAGVWRKSILELTEEADLSSEHIVSEAPEPHAPLVGSASAAAAPKKDKSRLYYPERYGTHTKSQSLEYDAHRDRHWNGEIVETYQRLLPIIPGRSVVEIGAAEGIMSLSIALNKDRVRSIEITPVRHQRAVELRDRWLELGKPVSNCEMMMADVFADPTVIHGFDTLYASRVIYYFGERLEGFMQNVARSNRFVVFVGNESRQRAYRKGRNKEVGEYAKYTSLEGLIELVSRHGYNVVNTINTGDPVVVGERR